jgi:hypothetical protein
LHFSLWTKISSKNTNTTKPSAATSETEVDLAEKLAAEGFTLQPMNVDNVLANSDQSRPSDLDDSFDNLHTKAKTPSTVHKNTENASLASLSSNSAVKQKIENITQQLAEEGFTLLPNKNISYGIQRKAQTASSTTKSRTRAEVTNNTEILRYDKRKASAPIADADSTTSNIHLLRVSNNGTVSRDEGGGGEGGGDGGDRGTTEARGKGGVGEKQKGSEREFRIDDNGDLIGVIEERYRRTENSATEGDEKSEKQNQDFASHGARVRELSTHSTKHTNSSPNSEEGLRAENLTKSKETQLIESGEAASEPPQSLSVEAVLEFSESDSDVQDADPDLLVEEAEISILLREGFYAVDRGLLDRYKRQAVQDSNLSGDGNCKL